MTSNNNKYPFPSLHTEQMGRGVQKNGEKVLCHLDEKSISKANSQRAEQTYKEEFIIMSNRNYPLRKWNRQQKL